MQTMVSGHTHHNSMCWQVKGYGLKGRVGGPSMQVQRMMGAPGRQGLEDVQQGVQAARLRRQHRRCGIRHHPQLQALHPLTPPSRHL